MAERQYVPVTCVCVTRGLSNRVRDVVDFWLAQTVRCHLLMLHEGLGVDLDSLPIPTADRRHLLEVIDARSLAPWKLTLGELRNVAMHLCTTDVWTQFDDDDWHAPDRVGRQYSEMQAHGLDAITLSQWSLLDSVAGTWPRAWVSAPRLWEGSIMVRRSATTAQYAPIARGEDVAFVFQLCAQLGQLAALPNSAGLYTYRYHGNNTFDLQHFEKLAAKGVKLSAAEAETLAGRFRP